MWREALSQKVFGVKAMVVALAIVLGAPIVCASARNLQQHQMSPIPMQRSGETRLDWDSSFTFLGRWAYGFANEVAWLGRFACVSNGATMQVVDLVDPIHPAVVGEINFFGSIMGLVVRDSLAYVMSTPYLYIVDLHNPQQPMELGSVFIGPELYDLAVTDSFAYFGTWWGFQCADVSNPTAPYLRSGGWLDDGNKHLAERERRVYVGNDVAPGIAIIDATNADSLRAHPAPGVSGYIRATLVHDDLLLVALAESGIRGLGIFSLVTPDSPAVIATLSLGDSEVRDIAAQDTIVYAVTESSDVFSVSIANPFQPTILGRYRTGEPFNSVFRVAAKDSLVCVTEGGRVRILTSARPDTLHPASFVPTGDFSEKVVIQDRYAYVASMKAGLWVLDRESGVTLTPVANLHTGGDALDLCVDGPTLYLACGSYYNEMPDSLQRLLTVDISNPSQPVIRGSVRVPFPYALAKSGNLVFVTGQTFWGSDTTLVVVDVADLQHPNIIGAITGTYESREIIASDSIAYLLAYNGGLKVVDCRNPSMPVIRSSFGQRASGAVLFGNLLYLEQGDTLSLLDVTDISHPERLGAWGTQPGQTLGAEVEMVIQRDHLICVGEPRIRMFDISNPFTPIEVLNMNDLWGRGVAIAGDTVLLTDYDRGVWITRNSHLAPPSSVSLEETGSVGSLRLRSYPNPVNSSVRLLLSVPRRERIRVELFNALGQSVGLVFDGTGEAGTSVIELRANDLPSGVYFCRAVSPTTKGVATMKILILK